MKTKTTNRRPTRTSEAAAAAGQRMAYFITPHGFGHAARAAAVMAAAQAQDSTLEFEIFTRVPEWFFRDTLRGPFGYHPVLTDVGMVQKTSLREDLPATLTELDRLLPFRESLVDSLAAQVSGCAAVLCDIAPLGIAAAKRAGVASVLVENFTWDWIYQGYVDVQPGFRQHISYLEAVFCSADYHIQTEPISRRMSADFTTPPVARAPRTARDSVRERLGIANGRPVALITMGGIPAHYPFLDRLRNFREVVFVVPGASEQEAWDENVLRLPHHSGLYHPDLIQAADAVIAKLGYSTVAETYLAGTPLGYIARDRFLESVALAEFVRTEMSGLEIGEAEFERGDWLERLPDLLARPRTQPQGNGAAQIAEFIRGLAGERRSLGVYSGGKSNESNRSADD